MSKAKRVRVDALVVERGLAATRAEATRLIMAGRVRLDGTPVDKAGRLVRADAALQLTTPSPYVGRGGEKLAAALAAFGVEPRGRVCLDVGASTGGFTDCLLKRGARRVYALDVGRGQLHPRLRSDPRVTVIEGVNARNLEASLFNDPPSLAVIDVAFISLEKVLPPVALCLGQQGTGVPQVATQERERSGLPPRLEIIPLVKPQFEVGRSRVGKGGVVRDRERQREVLVRLVAFSAAHGLAPEGVTVSPLRGAKGNREFFVHLVVGGVPLSAEQLASAVGAAVNDA